MLTAFLSLSLALAAVLAGAGILFLLITRRVRAPSGESQ